MAPAPRVLVRVLGGTDLELRGRPVSLSPQQRQLVGAVAAGPRHGTSTTELIDRLWGERPPARARKLLQGLVLRVRRTISSTEPGGEVFRTTERGYAVSGASVDAEASVEVLYPQSLLQG